MQVDVREQAESEAGIEREKARSEIEGDSVYIFPQKAVKTDIDLWYSRYGVDGIFLDEQANTADKLPHDRETASALGGYPQRVGHQRPVAHPGGLQVIDMHRDASRFGFQKIGTQIDDIDGPEDVFLLRLDRPTR